MVRKIVLLLLVLYTKGSVSSFLPISSNDPVTRKIAFYPNRQQHIKKSAHQVVSATVHPSLHVTSAIGATAKTSSSSSMQQPAAEDIWQRGNTFGSYSDYLSRMQKLARTTSTDPTAVQQAHELFNEMVQAFMVTKDSSLWPNIDIYNLVMETNAYSSDPMGAEKVDQILTFMEDGKSPVVSNKNTEDTSPRPNLESYAKLMEAWSRRRQIDKVKAVVDRIITSSTNIINNLKPDTYIYNKLIRAYGMAGQPDEARNILDNVLLKGYMENGDKTLRPNAKTWTHVLRAYANAAAAAAAGNKRGQQQEQEQVQQQDYLETIQDLMRQMAQYARRNDEVDWKPGVDAYNALLRCISLYTSSTTSSRQQEQQQQQQQQQQQPVVTSLSASKEAESVLYGMIEQYRENDNDEDIKPNDESFFHVMNAYRGETDAGVAIKVEKLLELQRALLLTTAQNTNKNANSSSSSGRRRRLEPSLRTCNAAIAAMSRTRDPQKAIRAQRLVQRMIKESSAGGTGVGAGDDEPSCKPNFTTYRNLLNTCAYSGSEATHTSPEDRLQTFQIAVETLNEIRRQYPYQEKRQQQQQQQQQQQLDSSIYSLFLRACSNLMPSNRKRDAVVESVFSKCCKDGLVNDAVLREFEKTASEELQLKIFGGFLEDGVQTPKQWSRNCSSK